MCSECSVSHDRLKETSEDFWDMKAHRWEARTFDIMKSPLRVCSEGTGKPYIVLHKEAKHYYIVEPIKI
jgi:hypothetical protein